jgi:hypothetical protein
LAESTVPNHARITHAEKLSPHQFDGTRLPESVRHFWKQTGEIKPNLTLFPGEPAILTKLQLCATVLIPVHEKITTIDLAPDGPPVDLGGGMTIRVGAPQLNQAKTATVVGALIVRPLAPAEKLSMGPQVVRVVPMDAKGEAMGFEALPEVEQSGETDGHYEERIYFTKPTTNGNVITPAKFAVTTCEKVEWKDLVFDMPTLDLTSIEGLIPKFP